MMIVKCKICGKNFKQSRCNEFCCSKECKTKNKNNMNKRWYRRQHGVCEEEDLKLLFENHDRETYIEWLVENKDYSLKTANEFYNKLRMNYMKGRNEELWSI